MSNCEKFEQLISNMCDDAEFDSEKKNELNAHLSNCPGCREFELSIQVSRETLRDLPTQKSKIAGDRLFLQRESVSLRPTIWRRKVAVPLPVIAATLIVFFGSWGLFLSAQSQSQNLINTNEQTEIQYVQILRVKAVSATLVENKISTDVTKMEKI